MRRECSRSRSIRLLTWGHTQDFVGDSSGDSDEEYDLEDDEELEEPGKSEGEGEGEGEEEKEGDEAREEGAAGDAADSQSVQGRSRKYVAIRARVRSSNSLPALSQVGAAPAMCQRF